MLPNLNSKQCRLVQDGLLDWLISSETGFKSSLIDVSVTDFTKKTGDYRSLSAIDIRVMALSYQLEKEHVGTDHIKTVPEKKVKTGKEILSRNRKSYKIGT